jgi:streptogramin lyase
MIGAMRRLILGLAVAGLALAPAAARADTTYYTLPSDFAGISGGLAVAPDGVVYFGGGNGFADTPPIGRLDPAQAVAGTSSGITGITTPDGPGCCSSIFRQLAWSTKDDLLYWTRSDSLVGTLKGTTVDSKVLAASPWGIAAAPGGGAWLAENSASNVGPGYAGNRVAQVSAALGVNEAPNLALQGGRTTLDPLRYDAKPRGIAVAADGTPWFAEADAGNPGYRIGTSTGSTYTEYSGPCVAAAPCSGSYTGSGITDVAVGKDGSVWYTNQITRSLGHLVVGGPQTEYALNTMAAGLGAGNPWAISAASDGSLWLAVNGSYGAPGANAIVHIVPGVQAADSPTATVYKLGAANAPLEVEPDNKGSVWFTGTAGAGGGPIGRIGDVPTGGGPTDPGTGTSTDPGTGDPTTPVTIPTTPTTTPPTVTLTPSTVGTPRVTDPTVSGDSVNANQICVGPPQDRCSLVYLIQTHEYVTGFPNTHGYLAKAKKLTTVGTLKVTLKGGEKKKVTIKLNRKGRKLRKKMAFKATLTVTQVINGAKPKQILKKSLKFKQ